jgi:hypothetical protein
VEDSRFDAWTRLRARSTGRRGFLGWSLAGGIAAGLSRVSPINAQFGGNGPCSFSITLTSTITAGAVVSGTLEFAIGADGAIDPGSLALEGQATSPVVGQASGPAVALLASLGDGTSLFLSGMAASDQITCANALQGHLSNADSGQLGTWIALPSGSNPMPTPTPVPQSNQSQSTGTTCPPTNCGDAFVLDQQSCQCVCRSSTVPCGQNCCPAGSACLDASSGVCGCPAGTVQCGTSCVPDCSGDEFLDFNSCTCVANAEPACIDLGGQCANSGQCCSGFCSAGTCASCAFRVCNDVCVDTSADNNNCGNCNNICIAPKFCASGACQG